jgi:hypothetical protein
MLLLLPASLQLLYVPAAAHLLHKSQLLLLASALLPHIAR